MKIPSELFIYESRKSHLANFWPCDLVTSYLVENFPPIPFGQTHLRLCNHFDAIMSVPPRNEFHKQLELRVSPFIHVLCVNLLINNIGNKHSNIAKMVI